MIFYSYYIYKRFSIKGLGIIIFKLFIFLTVYLALQILILYGIIDWKTGFSWGSIILYYMYDAVFAFVIYYMAIILALFFRCPNLLKELREHLNRIYSQFRQYVENLNTILSQNNQIFSQNNKNRRKRYNKFNF
jgi:ABC-type multidrug transport system fused ATPase/permease subunit